MPRAALLVSRFAFLGFFSLSYLYCLFAYVPFTWTQVLKAGLLPFLSTFARIHPWLFWAAALAALATLWPDLRSEVAAVRRAALVYAACAAAAGVALVVRPVLATLENDRWSLVYAQLALLPPLGLALVDHLAARGKIAWSRTSTREDGSVFAAAASCLVVVFAVYGAVFHVRARAGLGLDPGAEATGLLWSLLLHASFAGMAFIVWCLVRALGTWMGGPRASVEYALVAVLAGCLFATLARTVAFESMTFRGAAATATAIAWAVVLVASVSGAALRGEAGTGRPVVSGLRLFLAPLSCPRARLAVRVAWLVLVSCVAVALQIALSRMDWNGLMQRLCACIGWIMVFAATLQLWRPGPPERTAGGRTATFIVLASVGTLAYGAWRGLGHPADTGPLRAKLAAAEPSFGLLYDIAGVDGRRESMGELFETMQRNTSLAPERRVEPLDVRFSAELGAAPGKRPHVFIIVVDSLRRDYVAPFNPAVTFTPSIERFARSSDVFVNAFTHYGATGLSEPSIWVGGMMPHKQYITPFAPMNALEKLLMADHYTRMVSVDSILAQLLDQGPSLVRLDANTVAGDLDLCTTLEELEARTRARLDEGAPFFAYTQPQNVHVSRIAREGASVPEGASYPGFYAPYASRLERIDACFGRFIAYLQAEGLYDESIVVLTADHGDLLGEEGRWGHAYMLNPEVVRIPLIIHRPEHLRSLTVDRSAVAFSTDITPSIYRLLGYMPADMGGGFGHSLYGTRAADRGWQMLVSSYGPVYGILEDEGRHLYVADAVGYSDAYYDVSASSNAPRDPASEEVRTRNVERIRAGIEELNETFHLEDLGAARAPKNAPRR